MTEDEHYLIRGNTIHPVSLENEAAITLRYGDRGQWVTCTCRTCTMCGQLIQTRDDGTLQTHGSGVGLRDICKGSHQFAPMPFAPAGYIACRVMGPNILTTHLVKLDHAGSNGGRPTVCGLTRFGDSPDLPSWGMGDSGVTGPGVKQLKCPDCYNQALAESAPEVDLTPTFLEPHPIPKARLR